VAKPEKEVPVALHELDACPIGSKLVGTEQGTVLATPEWEKLLPRTDLAGRLPTGARIQKISDAAYRSVQLDPAQDRPALITATAYDAVTQFVAHFHD
jgi:hypothetical protein